MILLDSSFIIALYNTRDGRHSDAGDLIKRIINKEFGDIFVSDYIFDEIATSLMRSIGHNDTTKICQALLDSSNLVTINEQMFREAFELFKKQKITKLSFTDCTNIILMEEKGIRNIATFDNDFESIPHVNVIG